MFLRTTLSSPTRQPRRYELLDAALERGLVPDALLRAGSFSAPGIASAASPPAAWSPSRIDCAR